MPALLRRLWIVGLVMAPACGNGGPAKVTAPSLTNITVSGSDLLLIGQSETFTAVGNGGSVLWLTDKRGRSVGVPSDKVAYVEIGASGDDRRVGFGAH